MDIEKKFIEIEFYPDIPAKAKIIDYSVSDPSKKKVDTVLVMQSNGWYKKFPIDRMASAFRFYACSPDFKIKSDNVPDWLTPNCGMSPEEYRVLIDFQTYKI